MGLAVIELPNNQDAIFSYKLAGSQTLSPKSAFVRWDGTGASGPFLAALTFTAPDGKVFSRVFPSTVIPQGGTADVTYAPFPGGIAQAAPATIFSWYALFTAQNDPGGDGDVLFDEAAGVVTPAQAVALGGILTVGGTWTNNANATIQPQVFNPDPNNSHTFQLAYLAMQDINSTDRAVYQGNPVVVPAFAQQEVTTDTLTFGSALLDISDPHVPRLVTTGTYAYTATILAV